MSKIFAMPLFYMETSARAKTQAKCDEITHFLKAVRKNYPQIPMMRHCALKNFYLVHFGTRG